MQIHSLIIGDPHGMDAVVAETLSISSSAQYLREIDDLEATERSPNLIVICQQWPDEFSDEQALHLFNIFPLARVVVSYSTWCSSDGRTRNVWPIAVRVETKNAPRRIRNEVEVLLGQKSPLPLTANYEEIFAFDHIE